MYILDASYYTVSRSKIRARREEKQTNVARAINLYTIDAYTKNEYIYIQLRQYSNRSCALRKKDSYRYTYEIKLFAFVHYYVYSTRALKRYK
jgi:hypothetical protein